MVSYNRLDELRKLAKQCDWSYNEVFINKMVNILNLLMKRLKSMENLN